MATIYFKNKVLIGKKEAVYGVQETLDSEENAILTRDLKIEPTKGDTEELTYDNGGIGHGPLQRTNAHAGVSFVTDFAASGTAGEAPAWGFLMEAAGFSEEIVEDTSAEYVFTNAPSSLTLAYQNGGNKHPGVGARGGAKLDLSPAKHPQLQWAFEMLRVAPSNAAFPVVDTSAWQKPLPVNFQNTTAVQLFGHTVALSACVIDFGQQVEVINVPGLNMVDLPMRKPVANITILDPGIAAKDFYALDNSGIFGNFQMVHGAGAGKILTLGSPALTQITNLQPGEYKGRLALSMTLRFTDGADGACDFFIRNT